MHELNLNTTLHLKGTVPQNPPESARARASERESKRERERDLIYQETMYIAGGPGRAPVTDVASPCVGGTNLVFNLLQQNSGLTAETSLRERERARE